MASAAELPVDVVEEIFLRLDDVADLVRASSACAVFRRVVSDGGFLRRFRSLHRPPVPVIGLLLDKTRHSETQILFPAQPPRRSAQAAAGFAKAADFTFSSLPEPKRWRICDARNGRVLLTRGRGRRRGCRRLLQLDLEDLVVYDPLHRGHVQIPTIPGDLLLSAEQYDNGERIMTFDDPFLAPAAGEDQMDNDEGFHFQVMLTSNLIALSKTKVAVVAFVLSSASGQWRCVVSFCTDFVQTTTYSRNYLPFGFRHYVHGCVCWAHVSENVMLVFDTREMKLSIVQLPRKTIRTKIAVEAGDGRFGVLYFSYDFDYDNGGTAMELYSKPLQGIKEPGEWRHDSSIPLISGFELMFSGAAEGYVLLLGFRHEQIFDEKQEAHYFTLELKTSLVEKLYVWEEFDDMRHIIFLYASFPPPFSPPSVCNYKNLSPVSTTKTC